MKEFYGFFDSTLDDVREYDAAQLANLLRACVQNGVSSHEGGLEVTSDGLSMTTQISPGGCVINGYVFVLEDDGGAQKALEHQPSAAADRYDRVVVRLDTGVDERKMTVELLTGQPSAEPVPPTLMRNATIYEAPLAKVRVRAGATVIAPDDVEDERSFAISRWVRDMLEKKVDLSTVVNTLDITDDGFVLDARQGKVLWDALIRCDGAKLDRSDVANDLRTNQPDKALSAAQGKVLNDAIAALDAAKASKQSAAISLPLSGWTETDAGFEQTVDAPFVTERCDVVCAHGDGCREAWLDSGVYAAAQAAGTLTFAAQSLPEGDLTANVLCIF